jgi:cytochrome c553
MAAPHAKRGLVKRFVSIIISGLVGVVLGGAAMRYYDQRRAAPQIAPVAAPAPAIVEQPRTAIVNLMEEPLWAYGFTEFARPGDKAQPQAPPTSKPRRDQDLDEQTRPRQVDGSSASYSVVQIRDLHNVVDWFPRDHPPMTDIIEHGPRAMGDQARGCGSCHLPNGRGRPENAPPAGLPVAYFLRQIDDFRRGLRYTADPRKANTNTMVALAKAMTDAEARDAAEYFAAIPPPATPWTRVVEATRAPKVRYVANLAVPAKEKGVEPLDGRIVEMPGDEEQTETLRNPRVGFVAYVPPGSIKKGEDLVTTGGMRIVNGKIVQGKTTACGTCHGLNLTGIVGADVPPIAGRSPSYVVRQLWDLQQGTRNGSQAQLMKLVVARLTRDDLVAIAAYLASRLPSAPQTTAARPSN